MSDVNSNIREFRRKKGITIKELAIGANVSAKTISNIELGKTKAKDYIVNRIAIALGVSYKDLTEQEYKEESIGNRIRDYRHRNNLTQKDFADMIGVSQSAESNYERDAEKITEINRLKILSIIDEPIDSKIDDDELVFMVSSIGNLLSERRHAIGLTVTDISKITGIHRYELDKLEDKNRNIYNKGILIKVLNVLGLKLNDINSEIEDSIILRNSIGFAIYMARRSIGVQQSKLAGLCNIEVETLYSIEHDVVYPSESLLDSICKNLNLNKDELINKVREIPVTLSVDEYDMLINFRKENKDQK